jgi:membrane peptidoglycan carboxypeptidase
MLTPFLYLTGFTRGLSPASLSWDIPGSIENFDGQYHGPVRLRTALVNDYLPPAEAILDQMGTESIARIAASFGLNIPAGTNPLKDEIPLSLLDAAAAYGVFANQGTLAGQELEGESIRPATVLEVTGVDGKIWADWTSPGVQAVVSPQLAYLMTDVLRDDNVRQATLEGVPALDIQRPAAVKVARTFSSGGAWTAGYTPQRVVVVHMQATGTPLVPAMDLWHALISYAVQDLPEEGWTTPAGITVMQVCDPSGMLPTEACQNMVREVFLSGNEPVQGDTLYQIVEVNRETGLLATVFTRSELVEERTFMIVPAEASAWAEGMGIAVPPTEYDVIQTMETNPDVTISSPALFAEINGQVEVRGTAAGANFASFRLEYGRGLNPHEWIQIGTDSNTAISAGVLGTWDTTGLDGLVVLRLMVVRTDQRVEQAVTVVTISTP